MSRTYCPLQEKSSFSWYIIFPFVTIENDNRYREQLDLLGPLNMYSYISGERLSSHLDLCCISQEHSLSGRSLQLVFCTTPTTLLGNNIIIITSIVQCTTSNFRYHRQIYGKSCYLRVLIQLQPSGSESVRTIQKEVNEEI